MNKALLVAPLLALCACTSPTTSNTPTPPVAPPLATAATPPTALEERLLFADAAWQGARGTCTENTAPMGCDSEWRHGATGQLVRVFVLPVKNEALVPVFIDKLTSDVTARGGLAERIEQGGMTVIRFLERSTQPVDGGVLDVATLNYALVGRDKRAVHLITSVVPFDDQQPSDARLRTLLTSASWSVGPTP